jgi:alpha-beta hydrolase superfamily lysophospholipase
MGGYIIMKYLESAHPAQAAILLSSIPVRGFWLGFWRTLRMFTLEHLWHVLTLRRNFFRVTAPQFDRYCFRQPMQPERLALYHSRLHLESFAAILDMIALDIPQPALAQSVPMLVLGGAHDVIFGVNETEATARAYRADCHIFPDLAHDIIREEGYNRTCEYVATWLQQKGLAR